MLLGGPLVRKSDGMLIGLSIATILDTPSSRSSKVFPVNQLFTKVSSYFDWMSEITKLDLPNCN